MRKSLEKKRNKKIMMVVGISAVVGLVILLLMILLSNEKYLPADNISVVSETTESKGEWEKIEKVVVKSTGIAVDSYSFDGGINWQNSNEYIATTKEKLVIIIRDVNGKESEPITYETMNIDSTPPVITVKLPKSVLLNSKINLGEYVSVTDDNSGVNGSIIMTPDYLDTSSVGKKTINFTAKDNAGNVANIDVTIEVVKNKNEVSDKETATVLYRYRVKNITEYACESHDCSYYSDTDIVKPTTKLTSTGKCDEELNEKITHSNGCYITPTPTEYSCTQAFVTVDRYSEYNDGKYIIDIIALDTNGEQIDGDSNYEEISKKPSASETSDTYEYIKVPSLTEEYKAAPCGKNEIEIYGYCHAICSKQVKTCSKGYDLVDGVCKKHITKTCSDTCTRYTWSKWSEWSETVIAPSETVQVETKVVND